MSDEQAYIEKAKSEYAGNGSIEIDDSGAYVQAWVYVGK